MADQGAPNLGEYLEDVPDQDLWEIWQSIVDGASTPAESFGLDEAALNTIERMAHGYYSATRFGAAAPIYGFLVQAAPQRASAWRGRVVSLRTAER